MTAHVFTDGEVATAAELNSLLPPVSVQSGVVQVTPVADTPTSVAVTFATPYAAAPEVVVTPMVTTVGDLVKGVGVSDVTETGFTLWVYRTNTTTMSVAWQAWGAPGGAFVDGEPAYASLLNAISSGALTAQVGTKTITPTAGDATSGTVTFPVAFASTPSVMVSPVTVVPGTTVLGTAVTEVTATGCKVWVWRSNTTSMDVLWIAVGRV